MVLPRKCLVVSLVAFAPHSAEGSRFVFLKRFDFLFVFFTKVILGRGNVIAHVVFETIKNDEAGELPSN